MPQNSPTCPNCKAKVQGGKICSNCGLDIQTGESFQVRVRKAKGEIDRPRPITGRLGVTVLIAFGFITLAGFMYQRRVTDILTEKEADYRPYIEQYAQLEALLQEIKDVAEAQEAEAVHEQAQSLADDLLADLQRSLESVDEEENGTQKALLRNLKAQTEHKLERILFFHGPYVP